jgi:hypothetical protein
MAVLTGPTVLYQDPASTGKPRVAVVSFPNVTAADTFDAATLPTPFVTVTAALGVATSNRTATTTLCTIASNTNISILGTGIARDSVVLFILGE